MAKTKTIKSELTIEQTVYNMIIDHLTKKGLEIFEKNLYLNDLKNLFDNKGVMKESKSKYEGNIKYFGNSTIDINFQHIGYLGKAIVEGDIFRIELFLDNNYNPEDVDGEYDIDEMIQTDESECLKELEPIIEFLKQHQIEYKFEYD